MVPHRRQRHGVHVRILHLVHERIARTGLFLFFAADRRRARSQVEQRHGDPHRRHVPCRILAAIDQFGETVQGTVEADERLDTRIPGGGHHVRQAAPAEPHCRDPGRIGPRQRTCLTDQPGDIPGLGLQAVDRERRRAPVLAERRTGQDDVAMARQVFAQVRVLDGVRGKARRIDRDREAALPRACIAHRQHRAGQVAQQRRAPRACARIDTCLGQAFHFGAAAPEVVLGRSGLQVVAEADALAAAVGRIPDDGLDRARAFSPGRFAGVLVDRRLVETRAVVLLDDLDADGVRTGRVRKGEGVGRVGGHRGGEQQEQTQGQEQ